MTFKCDIPQEVTLFAERRPIANCDLGKHQLPFEIWDFRKRNCLLKFSQTQLPIAIWANTICWAKTNCQLRFGQTLFA